MHTALINILMIFAESGEGWHQKATALVKQISNQWNAMSSMEKKDATKGLIEDLEDHREMKALSTWNMPIATFHDADTTIQNLEKEVCLTPHFKCIAYKQLKIDPLSTCMHWHRSNHDCHEVIHWKLPSPFHHIHQWLGPWLLHALMEVTNHWSCSSVWGLLPFWCWRYWCWIFEYVIHCPSSFSGRGG
jgi:hypothetical protein